MIIDCISDLHGDFPDMPGGDLLIVAGDLTAADLDNEYLRFFIWIGKMRYRKKILIAGNHDMAIEKNRIPVNGCMDFEYLEDSGTEFEYFDSSFPEEDTGFLPSGHRTLKIWGSPWSLTFRGINPKCTAFTGNEGVLRKKYDLIPEDTDILVTHGPPRCILDSCHRVKVDKYGKKSEYSENVGSTSLRERLEGTLRPKLHVFGHIHGDRGTYMTREIFGTTFVNASHVNEDYDPVHPHVRIEL